MHHFFIGLHGGAGVLLMLVALAILIGIIARESNRAP
jgi:hypothetical protein